VPSLTAAVVAQPGKPGKAIMVLPKLLPICVMVPPLNVTVPCIGRPTVNCHPPAMFTDDELPEPPPPPQPKRRMQVASQCQYRRGLRSGWTCQLSFREMGIVSASFTGSSTARSVRTAEIAPLTLFGRFLATAGRAYQAQLVRLCVALESSRSSRLGRRVSNRLVVSSAPCLNHYQVPYPFSFFTMFLLPAQFLTRN